MIRDKRRWTEKRLQNFKKNGQKKYMRKYKIRRADNSS